MTELEILLLIAVSLVGVSFIMLTMYAFAEARCNKLSSSGDCTRELEALRDELYTPKCRHRTATKSIFDLLKDNSDAPHTADDHQAT